VWSAEADAFGAELAPRDLRLALVEASAGRIGSPVDQLLLFCFHYDPTTGRYGGVALASMRVAGALTVLALAGAIVVMLRRERAAEVFDHLASIELGGVTVETEVVDGPAPEALAEVARLRDAEEIAVGSRGFGRIRGALGSVSRRVLRIADRPVGVVPRREAETDSTPTSDGRAPLFSPISTHRFRF